MNGMTRKREEEIDLNEMMGVKGDDLNGIDWNETTGSKGVDLNGMKKKKNRKGSFRKCT